MAATLMENVYGSRKKNMDLHWSTMLALLHREIYMAKALPHR
jgi:hypothetical protein